MGVLAKEIYSSKEWESLLKKDPSYEILQSANWQDPTTFASTHHDTDFLGLALSNDGTKQKELGWRNIQSLCWQKYRTFGPINASVNSKSDYVTGDGFSVYSDNLDINRFLVDLIYSRRNRLYQSINGWMVRMQAEGELFTLISFDEKGSATIRVLEPSRVGLGDNDDGLIVHPDDSTQTLFYSYRYRDDKNELIPDVNILFDPDLIEAAKSNRKFQEDKTLRSRNSNPAFKKIKGYSRFILHWKNLTGIHEYRRDTSHLRTVLEAINLYWTAIKWELDHKKAQTAYTVEVSFDESPSGRVAWQIWKKMSDADKAKTGLTKALTPGSRIFTMPGMSIKVHAPQLTKLSGENQDLLNIAGAGARTPQDLWQGQSSGASFSSLKMTRPPLIQEIKNMGFKLMGFLKYEFLRTCFYGKSVIGGDFPMEFKKTEVEEFTDGVPKFKDIDVEPIELVSVTFPVISLENAPEKKANSLLGSKHAGLRSLGISDDHIAKQMGIADLARQKNESALEEKVFGKKHLIGDAEVAAEEAFSGADIEGAIDE